MSKNLVWELMAKKLAGEASDAELCELESLLKEFPDMHYPIQTIADLWHQPTPDSQDAQQAFSHHASRMKSLGLSLEPIATSSTAIHPYQRIRQYWPAVMAIIIIAGGWMFLSRSANNTSKPSAKDMRDKSEISTRYGSRTKLVLPDSTQVWLNSGSKLTYDKSYGSGSREVALSGEAYFDVVKNPLHPFIIHTSSIDIKVLGTAFNVKSFPNEKNTETSLIRGSIEVTFRNRPQAKIILKPNEKLITSNEELTRDAPAPQKVHNGSTQEPAHAEPLVMVSHLTYAPADSTVVETSWLENKLIFRSETFEELAVKMERWYGVHIEFADENIKPKRLNGIFENESIQQALHALQLVTPFNYHMNKDEITISSK